MTLQTIIPEIMAIVVIGNTYLELIAGPFLFAGNYKYNRC
jgi:hypothetical protein